MAVRGASSKEVIIKKLLEAFPGAFMDDKVVRVPMTENGDTVEIKIALTAAKDVLGGALGSSAKIQPNSAEGMMDFASVQPEVPAPATAPTEEEKENVKNLLARLNLL